MPNDISQYQTRATTSSACSRTAREPQGSFKTLTVKKLFYAQRFVKRLSHYGLHTMTSTNGQQYSYHTHGYQLVATDFCKFVFSKAKKFRCACTKHPGFRKGAKTANKMIVCAANALAEYGQDGCVKHCFECVLEYYLS